MNAWHGVVAMLPMLVGSFASAETVPFMLTSPPEVEATLNQDGSWTIRGSAEDFDLDAFDDGFVCLVRELRKARPPSNPNPDNSAPMSIAAMGRVLCNDPIVRACLAELRPYLSCEVVIGRGPR